MSPSGRTTNVMSSSAHRPRGHRWGGALVAIAVVSAVMGVVGGRPASASLVNGASFAEEFPIGSDVAVTPGPAGTPVDHVSFTLQAGQSRRVSDQLTFTLSHPHGGPTMRRSTTTSSASTRPPTSCSPTAWGAAPTPEVGGRAAVDASLVALHCSLYGNLRLQDPPDDERRCQHQLPDDSPGGTMAGVEPGSSSTTSPPTRRRAGRLRSVTRKGTDERLHLPRQTRVGIQSRHRDPV